MTYRNAGVDMSLNVVCRATNTLAGLETPRTLACSTTLLTQNRHVILMTKGLFQVHEGVRTVCLVAFEIGNEAALRGTNVNTFSCLGSSLMVHDIARTSTTTCSHLVPHVFAGTVSQNLDKVCSSRRSAAEPDVTSSSPIA